jgi:hypothetical protein
VRMLTKLFVVGGRDHDGIADGDMYVLPEFREINLR